ncbi:putative nitrosoguanidine resistance protein SNG1 [Xylogone sp. PMI_703]|nr:putative nitrosoguanidine resistance protein SNG1 [Xylogone sp. PMI_703]
MMLKAEGITSKNRLSKEERSHPFWQRRRQKFYLVVGVAALLLQLVFLGNLSYLYGSLYNISQRFSTFKVLWIDLDGGIVGDALDVAYQSLKGPSFPSLIPREPLDFPSEEAALQALKDGSYWAAIIANANSSERLSSALRGGKAAQDYNPEGALTYIWNEVRYPAFADEVFMASFEALAAATRLAYNSINSGAAFRTLNASDNDAIQVPLNPIGISEINIMPTHQGARLLYNTATMVMPILQQFFLLLIMNGISHELRFYNKFPIHLSGLARLAISLIYGLVASLCMTGYIWAFRESWPVDGSQFALTWMVLWLLHHIHFVFIDSMTAFFPLPVMPFFIITWTMLNLTSSLSPFELNPGFYRWAYALPTHEAYTVLTDIWSWGSVPELYRALPIMFSWWIVGISAAFYGHCYRCHKAYYMFQKEIEPLTREVSSSATTVTLLATEAF